MSGPSLADIDGVRSRGFRPEVVGCFLCDKKLLFVYKKKHDLWQLPQGGIENGETLERAFWREMKEELGKEFVSRCGEMLEYFGTAQLKFPRATRNSRSIKGKKYFFVACQSKAQNVDIEQTEFDDVKWVSRTEFEAMIKKIYQQGKKRITAKIIGLLRETRMY